MCMYGNIHKSDTKEFLMLTILYWLIQNINKVPFPGETLSTQSNQLLYILKLYVTATHILPKQVQQPLMCRTDAIIMKLMHLC